MPGPQQATLDALGDLISTIDGKLGSISDGSFRGLVDRAKVSIESGRTELISAVKEAVNDYLKEKKFEINELEIKKLTIINTKRIGGFDFRKPIKQVWDFFTWMPRKSYEVVEVSFLPYRVLANIEKSGATKPKPLKLLLSEQLNVARLEIFKHASAGTNLSTFMGPSGLYERKITEAIKALPGIKREGDESAIRDFVKQELDFYAKSGLISISTGELQNSKLPLVTYGILRNEVHDCGTRMLANYSRPNDMACGVTHHFLDILQHYGTEGSAIKTLTPDPDGETPASRGDLAAAGAADLAGTPPATPPATEGSAMKTLTPDLDDETPISREDLAVAGAASTPPAPILAPKHEDSPVAEGAATPAAAGAATPAAAGAAPPAAEGVTKEEEEGAAAPTAEGAAAPTATPAAEEEEAGDSAVNDLWEALKDDDGDVYQVNKETGKSQWEKPEGFTKGVEPVDEDEED